MNNAPRTLIMLAAGVVLLIAATLAADVMLSSSAIRVVGPPTASDGEVLYSEMTGGYPFAAAIHGYAPGSGQAVYGEAADGVGVYGTSSNAIGVRGTGSSYGVYGTSTAGTAVWGGSTAGTGVEGASSDGVGVYGTSSDGRGVHGDSTNDHGVHGESYGDYGGYFTSSTWRGMYVKGAATRWDAYFGGDTGIYVADDIVAGGSKAGYVVDLARNDGPDPLRVGDVVVINGATDPVLGEIPVPTVRLADASSSTAVLGVVDRMFATPGDIASIPEGLSGAWRELTRTPSPGKRPMEAGAEVEDVLPDPTAKLEPPVLRAESPGRFVSQAEADFLAVAAGGDSGIAPGAYVGVVTLGAFKAIRVDASHGSILPGDLLVSSPTPGHAMRAVDPRVGTVIGKALGGLEGGQGSIPVLITLD